MAFEVHFKECKGGRESNRGSKNVCVALKRRSVANSRHLENLPPDKDFQSTAYTKDQNLGQ